MVRRFRILFIPSGGRLSPATRYRVHQILPFLEKEGIDYEVYSIFSERLTTLMIRSSTFGRLRKALYYAELVMDRFIRSWKAILLADKFDLVFLQRTTFPLGLERLLKARNKNIIFDIDDSIYLPDKEEKNPIGYFKRYIKKREVISVLKVARCAIVENNYIRSFVRKYCRETYLIVGPIDTERNFARVDGQDSKEITIGWIGTPSTTPYLKMLDGALKELSKKYDVKVRLIGASPYSVDGVRIESVKWSEETEISELHKFDIGVMSMPDNEWTRGKVGCKMLQYMANAIPAVVSYTPTTAEIIQDGINGFLASSEKEWVDKISLLIDDPALKDRMGREGRRSAEKSFSLDASIPRYLGIFKDYAASKH